MLYARIDILVVGLRVHNNYTYIKCVIYYLSRMVTMYIYNNI